MEKNSFWRQIQKKNFTKWEELANFLKLDENKRHFILKQCDFPLNFPKRLAEKVKKNCLDDPILLQFLPHVLENEQMSTFSLDPVEECSFQKTPKLLQKYPKRVLLLSSSACVMHCRFCFRRHYPYQHEAFDFKAELETIRQDDSICEVILSGGDPLSLSDEKLKLLIMELEKIPHVKLLRFHTRFPIGIPERITEDLLDVIKNSRLQTIFIIHTNHVKELDEDVINALKKIKQVGATLLSQTVLLHKINDSIEAMEDLFLKLTFNGIIPYYLHQLDRVDGASHFEVDPAKGKVLIQSLRNRLPGYAIPLYVQEIPHKQSKTPL